MHIAHGYLLSQFLSPYSNHRKDKWGGSTEKRFHIIRRILKGIQKALPGYPVLVKLNGYDNRNNGMDIDEAVEIAKFLEMSGCAAIEVSCGFPEDGDLTARGSKLPVKAVFNYHSRYKKMTPILKAVAKKVLPILLRNNNNTQSYNVNAASRIKSAVSIPVFAVGGINSLESINYAVKDIGLDAVSMCRPLILEPNLVNKLKEGTSIVAKCTQCNYCGVIQEKLPLKCY